MAPNSILDKSGKSFSHLHVHFVELKSLDDAAVSGLKKSNDRPAQE